MAPAGFVRMFRDKSGGANGRGGDGAGMSRARDRGWERGGQRAER